MEPNKITYQVTEPGTWMGYWKDKNSCKQLEPVQYWDIEKVPVTIEINVPDEFKESDKFRHYFARIR